MANYETVRSTSAPWEAQQPYLQDIFQQSQGLLNTGGPQYYQGNLTPKLSGQTKNALNMYQDQAMGGSQQIGALDQQMTGTLRGDYLNSNPYLDAMMNSASRGITQNYQSAVAPGIGANFDSQGRYGSGLYQDMMGRSQDELARGLGETAQGIYGQNYANERQNQMRAAQLAPQTAPMNYYDASQLLNVGNVYDQRRQQKANNAYNKFNFEQERPWDALGRHNAMIQGNYGSQQQQTNPLYKNTFGNVAGGAAVGAGVADALGYGGWGQVAGGALGGLGGWVFGG